MGIRFRGIYGAKDTDVLLQMLNVYIGNKSIASTNVELEMYSNFGLIWVNLIMPMPVPTSLGSNASSHGHVNPSDMEASVDATFHKLPSSPKLCRVGSKKMQLNYTPKTVGRYRTASIHLVTPCHLCAEHRSR